MFEDKSAIPPLPIQDVLDVAGRLRAMLAADGLAKQNEAVYACYFAAHGQYFGKAGGVPNYVERFVKYGPQALRRIEKCSDHGKSREKSLSKTGKKTLEKLGSASSYLVKFFETEARKHELDDKACQDLMIWTQAAILTHIPQSRRRSRKSSKI